MLPASSSLQKCDPVRYACRCASFYETTCRQPGLRLAHLGGPLIFVTCGAGLQASCQLLVFNLFRLEVFHIAEAMGVRCLAASPCLVPYSCPAGFRQRFAQQQPELFAALQQAPPGKCEGPTSCSD